MLAITSQDSASLILAGVTALFGIGAMVAMMWVNFQVGKKGGGGGHH